MPRRHNQYNGIHTPAMLHHNGLIEENGGLHHEALERVDPGGGVGSQTECCVPNGCEQGSTIDIRDLSDVVKVLCNNENCKKSRACDVLSYYSRMADEIEDNLEPCV
ncbi:unnamed protein product [Cyprideis torosa]|uniref:Headcase N-terminal domain-containing protein n=1 Tax=Cyprideis torosa TaxID=163714 RepID=A0A7R8WCH3_9CRUS|nr:unnamed protein product [Cyprideis torosa]CAG0888411.1 unnamed protein product [Cyprideis torosa]